MRPADNLQRYLSEAILPPVKEICDTDSTHYMRPTPQMDTSGKPSYWRKLGYIKRLRRATFDKSVLQFQKQIPCEALDEPDLDSITGERLSVAASNDFDIKSRSIAWPSSSMAVEELALQTASRALHMAFPLQREWSFMESIDEYSNENGFCSLHKLVDPFSLSKSNPTSAMLVFVFSPKLLVPAVVDEFVCTARFKSKSYTPVFEEDLPLSEQIWTKVWDICVKEDAHHFAITSYETWLFGGFSQGWTIGFSTFAKQYEAADPTILQCLVTWMASSLDLDGSFDLPTPLEDVSLAKASYEAQGNNPPPHEMLDIDEDWGEEEKFIPVLGPPELDVDTYPFTDDCSTSHPTVVPGMFAEVPEEPLCANPRDTSSKIRESITRRERVAEWLGVTPPDTGVVQHHPEDPEWSQGDDVSTQYLDPILDDHDLPQDEKYELLGYRFKGKWKLREVKQRALVDDQIDKMSHADSSVSDWSTVGMPLEQPFGGMVAVVQENNTYPQEMHE